MANPIMAKDYYEILGVGRSASEGEIKQAFRKLAHQHHPDKAGGDEAKFKELNNAYQVLSNPEKRQQYDRFGASFDQAGRGGFNPNDFASAFRSGGANQNFSFEFGDLGDMVGEMFGFGGGRSRTRTGSRQNVGADLEASLTISFEESVFGVEKSVSLTRDDFCDTCQGKGYEAGSKLITCTTCKGTGQTMRQVGFGISFATPCPECHGAGSRPEKACVHCHGRGTVRTNQNINVKIPAGISSGQSIRLMGKGQAVSNGTAGNLYIRVSVSPHPEFERLGDNIVSERKITISQAALGDHVPIKTIEGEVNLKVPEGTQSGQVFRIKAKGVPHVNGRGRGDHLVKVVVETPSRLSRRQKQLLHDLQSEGL